MSECCKVLLVDDEPANLFALEAVLRDLDYELTRCGSGEEALRELLRDQFAVVLLDLQMPTLDGIAVARMIRQREATRSTPIIFITAYDADAAQMHEAYSVGAVDFLHKPVNAPVLRAKVRFFAELYMKNEQLRSMKQQLHEAELGASRERARLVMEHVRDWAFIEMTTAGQVLGWSAGARDITGWSDDEVIGKDIGLLFTAEDIASGQAHQQRAEALRTGRAADQRWHVRKDGSRFLADGVTVAVCDHHGVVQSLAKIFQDATTRVTHEMEREVLFKEARATNDSLNTIFEQAPAFLCALRGPDHVFEMANERYYQLINKGAEIIGRPVRDVLPEVESQGFMDLLDQVYRSGEPFVGHGLEMHLHNDDGSTSLRIMDFVYTAMRDAVGQVNGILAHGVDITDKKRLEEAARTSDARYRQLISSIDEGFCLIDMLFDEAGVARDYRFAEINGEFSAQTGLRPDCVGKTVLELVPDIDPTWIARYGKVATTGEALRFTDEVSAMGRWFDVYATRLGDAGSSTVALLFRDISKQRKADEDLRRLAAELTEASRRKSEFLAVLAHELRNPLAPIRTGLELLRMRPGTPPEVLRVRDMMDRQVSQMVHLIDDLLDIARITSGKVELNPTTVALREVIATAIETSRPSLDAANHRFVLVLPDPALQVVCDPVRMAQVLGNLLTNAAKYTPQGGAVTLTVAREDSMIVIRVRDSGVGIPAEALPHVFDMFSQVSRNLGRAQGGLGIGLSIVRQIVELHGGSVGVDSDGVGKGSCFWVRLPVLASVPAPLATVVAAPTAGGGGQALRIVVADDNVDAATMLASLLQLRGHLVEVAHDGVAAVRAAIALQPDMMFLDIGMPGMTGHEVARAVRAQPELVRTRLVAVTGWGTQEDLIRAREAGFDHHLTKPAQFGEVDKLLQDALADASLAADNY